MGEWDCVRVPREQAERARRLLRARGLLVPGARLEAEGGMILMPVVSAGEALSLLGDSGLDAEPCGRRAFRERRRPGRLEGPVRGYTRIGDIVVFSHARGVGIEEYRRAAERLVDEGLARSVWLKLGTEGGERVARLVHLAGEKRTVAVVREYGLQFLVDIARVYYNPRLQEERRRIASRVSDGDRVLDMFAGVGPFSIHVASTRAARVLAVDINPEAVRLMVRNIVLNRSRLKGCVTPMLADSSLLPQIVKGGFSHIIMNNPTMTPRFLPQACALAGRGGQLHYYRVASTCNAVIREAVEGAPCRLEALECVRVLDYSPRTYIFRATLIRK